MIMKEYNSVLIEDNEVEFLLDIDQLTGETFRVVPFPGDIDTAMDKLGFKIPHLTLWYKNHHVVGLCFYNSKFKEFPDSISNLSHLRYLLIFHGLIQSFPNTMRNLSNLELLEIFNDPEYDEQINLDFPDIFKNLKILKKIHISGLFNVYFPPSFADLENLEELSLRYCWYSPNRSNFMINTNIDIEDPECYNNFFFELPADIGKITSLKKIQLYYSRIKHLPKSIINLPHLKELIIQDNNEKIDNIEIVFEIKSLENLTINDCELGVIPQKISYLINLKKLDLYRSNLKYIPIEIVNCKNLEILNINSNYKLRDSIDNWIKYLIHLSKLKLLKISRGYLDLIPKELLEKKGLEFEYS